VEQDRSLLSLFEDDSKRLFKACGHLKSLKAEEYYDSDSSEAMEAKEMVCLWKKKFCKTREACFNNLSLGKPAAKAPLTATSPAAALKQMKPSKEPAIDIDQSPDILSSESSSSAMIWIFINPHSIPLRRRI
jgi:hypothetical protein